MNGFIWNVSRGGVPQQPFVMCFVWRWAFMSADGKYCNYCQPHVRLNILTTHTHPICATMSHPSTHTHVLYATALEPNKHAPHDARRCDARTWAWPLAIPANIPWRPTCLRELYTPLRARTSLVDGESIIATHILARRRRFPLSHRNGKCGWCVLRWHITRIDRSLVRRLMRTLSVDLVRILRNCVPQFVCTLTNVRNVRC